MMRYERMNPCKECIQHSASCGGENTCKPVRQKKLRPYTGIRFTSDGFDCAFPVSIDVHSVCSFGCLYCFAVNTIQGRVNTITPIGEASLNKWLLRATFGAIVLYVAYIIVKDFYNF